MKKSSDIIIIGGGVIGCAIAYRLAGEGLKVTVIEKGEPGQEASWAAAGMLTPQSEAAHSIPEILANLLEASHALYPDFVAELQEESGIEIGYQKPGSIMVATDFQEARVLAGLLERQLAAGKNVEELTAQQIKEMQPGLADSVQSGLYFPDDHAVKNRELLSAIVMAATTRGVEFRTQTAVTGLEFNQSKVTGVKISEQVIHGDMVINAAGCWSGQIDPNNQIVAPVRPIRGQIVCLQKEPQTLNYLLHSSGCYIVPWPDGRTLIGSTLENVGYDKSVTAHGVNHLLTEAMKIVPEFASTPVQDFWAGLRPDTPDNLPILGTTHLENYIVASGHFRNGILLTPITAKIITDLVMKGKTSISIEPFSPLRFGATSN